MNWIEINERLPEANTPVLVYVYSFGDIGIARLSYTGTWHEVINWAVVSGDWGHYDHDNEITDKITHWMPLPDKPE